MKRLWIVIVLLAAVLPAGLCQEVLSPAGYPHVRAKASQAVRLPFFDDFSNYSGAPKSALWDCTSPFVNQDYADRPPTLGVVTLDAVDASGALHPGAGISPFPADTLLSCPIRLDSVFSPVRKRLQPSDSLYLSFYYLPGGGSGNMWERDGDQPEPSDSLILELFNPTLDEWVRVWGRGGVSVDTLVAHTDHAWQYVAIPILDAGYFSSQFRFRFRNLCSLDDMSKTGLIGNSDHWHLDYVYLHYNRSRSDQRTFDVAFVNKAPSLLRRYQAMPARQYQASDMQTAIDLTITNLYTTPVAVRYTYAVLDEAGNELAQYDGGNDNVPCYFPSGTYHTAQPHAHPAVTYQFPVSTQHHSYTVRHVVRGSVTPDDHPANDTTLFRQVFADYYAYDDGVAENGYGLTSTSSRVRLAYGFDLNRPDTLTALDIYFNHTRNDETSGLKFYICVWSSVDGRPGELLYKDTQKRSVRLGDLNRYERYVLEQELLVSGPVFVGIEQTTSDYLNLGFDRGHDAREHTYYQTSGTWQQSILRGALMMRPYFGHAATVGLSQADGPILRVYPSPASRTLCIDSPTESFQATLLDLQGRSLYSGTDRSIDVSRIPSGLYLLRLLDLHTGRSATSRVLIVH